MKRDPRVERIERLIEPIAQRENLELVDIELKREAIGLVLRVYLDTMNGSIDVDGLAKANQGISAALDEADIISQHYVLEVSSPGIDRPLTKPEHFKRFVGSNVSVKTEAPIENRRQFKGQLVEAGDNSFAVDAEGTRYEISYDNVTKARLQVEIKF